MSTLKMIFLIKIYMNIFKQIHIHKSNILISLAATLIGVSLVLLVSSRLNATTTTTIGTNTVLTSSSVILVGYKAATQYNVTQSGTISSISMYVSGANGSSGTQSLMAAVYADSNNTPGSLLNYSTSQTVAAKQQAGWVNFSLRSAISVTAGTKIWLTAFSPSGSNVIELYADSAAGYTSSWSPNSGSTPSTSYGTNNAYIGRTDMYATETIASPTPTATPTPTVTATVTPTITSTPTATPTVTPTTTVQALATWETALANRATKPAKWVAVGESVTEGQGASVRSNRWLDLVTSELRTNYSMTNVIGGENYIPAVYRVYPSDSPWTDPWSSSTGTITPAYWAPDLGYRALELSAGASVTYPVTGDSADIWYVGGSGVGTLSYKVDNGSTTSVNTNVATYSASYQITNVSLGASGSHTITISATGNPVYFDGFTIYNGDRNSGIQAYDSGYSGATAYTFLQDIGGFANSIGEVAPQLVTIELGINDYSQQTDPASFKSQVQQIITAIEGLPTVPSIELIIPYQAYEPTTLAIGYQTYVQELKSIAAADPTHVTALDLSASMPIATTSGTGDYTTDGIHPNNTGQKVVANLVYSSITQ